MPCRSGSRICDHDQCHTASVSMQQTVRHRINKAVEAAFRQAMFGATPDEEDGRNG